MSSIFLESPSGIENRRVLGYSLLKKQSQENLMALRAGRLWKWPYIIAWESS